MILEAIREVLPEVVDVCVPECVYRGFCPELNGGCGYASSEAYQRAVQKYRIGE